MSNQDSHHPPGNPPEEQGDNSTGKETQSAGTQNEPAFDKKELGLPLVEFLVGVGFASMVADLLDERFHIAAIVFRVLGVFLAEFAIAHLVFRVYRHKAKLVWFCFATAIAAELLFVAIQKKEEPPRLSFAFVPNVDRPAGEWLHFTNDLFPNKRGAFHVAEVRGALLIPYVAGESNAALHFALMHPEGPFCEVAQLQIQSDALPPLVFGKGWSPLRPDPPMKSAGVMKCDELGFSPSSAVFPEIKCSQISQSNRWIMFAHIRAKGFEEVDLRFWLVFSTNVRRAHIVKTGFHTNAAGTEIGLDIPNPERQPSRR